MEGVDYLVINGRLLEVGSKTASMLIPEATDALVCVVAKECDRQRSPAGEVI